MQTLTEKAYGLAPPGGLFDETAVVNLLPELSPGARKALVHRAVKSGEVVRLRPGLFCLAERYRRSHPHPFVVAAVLHYPSHISLQTALSHHGLIPEAVYQVSSVTSQRSRTFRTPLGIYSYDRVPCKCPRAGVRSIRVDENAWAFVASPVRAIADLVYLNRAVCWAEDGLRFLSDSMRMEMDDMQKLSLEDFQEVCDSIRNRRTLAYLAGLKQELYR